MNDLGYKKHLFVCTNKKQEGTGCGVFLSSEDTLKELKSLSRFLNQNSLEKVRVSQSGCLGRCKEGPVAVLYPQGHWFHLDEEEEKEMLTQLFQAD